MPAVSVVMPAYNAAAFVDESLAAIIAQGYRDWEVIVVDDRSTDDTLGVASRRAREDDRIKVIGAERNGGPAATRNTALAVASGRYIAFCDSDDVWLPTKLDDQMRFMKDRKAALSFTAFRRITEDGSTTGRLIGVPETVNYLQLLGNTAIATSSVLLDREIVGDVRMTDTYYDDFVLWLSILKRGVSGHGLNKDLLRYRVVQGSWSRSKANSAGKVWKTYREVEGLGLWRSTVSFLSYAARGYGKYRKF